MVIHIIVVIKLFIIQEQLVIKVGDHYMILIQILIYIGLLTWMNNLKLLKKKEEVNMKNHERKLKKI